MPRNKAFLGRLAGGTAALLLFMGLVPVALADDAFQQLRAIQEQAGEAQSREAAASREIDRLGADVASLKSDLVTVAAEIRQIERDRLDLDGTVAELMARDKELTAALASKQVETAKLVSALVRLARLPPEAVLALQNSPIDLVRSGIVVRSMVPAMRGRAAVLGAELADLASLREELQLRRHEIGRLEEELTERRSVLAGLIEKRAGQQRRNEQERQGEIVRIATLAAQAESLREIIARLERESALAGELPRIPAPETVFALVMPEIESGETASIWPVSGTVKEPFGQSDGQGGISRGVTLSASPNAIVISPLAGAVRFAGPFLNYKHILILEHSGGYHSLIAGLARIDAVIGDAILAGEPVGVMGNPAEGGSDLYFELRQNGQPVNPQQALATGAVKGSG